MIVRLHASLEIHKQSDESYELSSSILKQHFGITSQHGSIPLFIKDLQKGICYPDDLDSLSKKYRVEENVLHSVIAKLKTHDLLIEEEQSAIEPQETLYDRQIRFFKSYEKQGVSGEAMNEHLQSRKVLIVGLGGYGSWAALLFARLGIHTIVGIDFDSVDISNLHRQILYNQKDLGQLKIEACKEKISECDENVHFIGHHLEVKQSSDLHVIMEDVDIVLNPFSYLPLEKAVMHPAGLVARAALDMDKPCLTFGGSWIGPLTIPKKTPCYFCAIKALSEDSNLDPNTRNPHIQKRAFAPPIATCCSLAVFEASRFLSGCDEPQTYKGVMQLDIHSFANNRFFSLQSDRECNFCLSQPSGCR